MKKFLFSLAVVVMAVTAIFAQGLGGGNPVPCDVPMGSWDLAPDNPAQGTPGTVQCIGPLVTTIQLDPDNIFLNRDGEGNYFGPLQHFPGVDVDGDGQPDTPGQFISIHLEFFDTDGDGWPDRYTKTTTIYFDHDNDGNYEMPGSSSAHSGSVSQTPIAP